jgi:hypothetical protein
VACAFKNYRNPRVRLMCLFLIIQKLVTFVYLLVQYTRSTEEYVVHDYQQIEFYL